MSYGKETLILKEVSSTLLSNKIRKMPNQETDKIEFDGHRKERKRRRKERFRLIKGVSLLSQRRLLEE